METDPIEELKKRAEDLWERCERSGTVTSTGFLTPAESYALERWAKQRGCSLLLSGGGPDCERRVAFFLPEWQEPEYFAPEEYIRAIRITAYFGTPGHRDYMGALLGMGIVRDRLGDIRVMENVAYVFCLPGISRHLLGIEKVGRIGVKAEEIAPESVPSPEKRAKAISFSVMSLRLDAVTAGMFNLSRTEAARQIEAGNVSLNYTETLRTDAAVKEGDILSLRGAGKGSITGTGGTSRKGRLFVYAEVLQ